MQSGKSTDFQCLELQTATLRTGCDGIDHLESTSRWRNSHDWFIMTPKTNRQQNWEWRSPSTKPLRGMLWEQPFQDPRVDGGFGFQTSQPQNDSTFLR